jgi:hypothetical protein
MISINNPIDLNMIPEREKRIMQALEGEEAFDSDMGYLDADDAYRS